MGIGDRWLMIGAVLIETLGDCSCVSCPLTLTLSPDVGEGRIIKDGLGVINELFEAGGVFFDELLKGLVGAGGGFEGDFLRQ